VSVHTTRSVTLGQIRHHSCREFLHLNWGIRTSLLVVQEHVYILNTVGQSPAAPFNIVEKELALKATSDFDGRPSIVRRDAVVDEQFSLYLGLNGCL
jgi:hypothetical protein